MYHIIEVPIIIAVVPYFRIGFKWQDIGTDLLAGIHYADLAVTVIVHHAVVVNIAAWFAVIIRAFIAGSASAVVIVIIRTIIIIIVRLLCIGITQIKQ